MRQDRRIVLLLTICQTLFQTGGVMLGVVGGLAGLTLAPTRLLATLPVAMVSVGTAISTIPAALVMARIGRRRGFMLGALSGAVGGALGALAMTIGNFWLLCAATALVGVYQGFAQFYRFAAAEAAEPSFKSRALSLVLTGGVLAAIVGPSFVPGTQALIPAGLYAGCYAAVAVLAVLAAAVLSGTPFSEAHERGRVPGSARPLRTIARQSSFKAAVGGAAAGYFVMVLAMTATPISICSHNQPIQAAATVIQWHVLGMYVPSFFTGWLIRKLGVARLMLTGVAVLAAHIAIAISGYALLNYLTALTLLGVGWNFLYVGGSTLLTETYAPDERAKVQALNDFVLVGVSAMAALSAGALNEAAGWRGLNLAATPVLLAAAVGILAYALSKRSPGPGRSAEAILPALTAGPSLSPAEEAGLGHAQ